MKTRLQIRLDPEDSAVTLLIHGELRGGPDREKAARAFLPAAGAAEEGLGEEDVGRDKVFLELPEAARN